MMSDFIYCNSATRVKVIYSHCCIL